MTPRAIRRAAERLAQKAVRKQQNASHASQLIAGREPAALAPASTFPAARQAEVSTVDNQNPSPITHPTDIADAGVYPTTNQSAKKNARPISQAQFAANRLNAKLSTGPTSPLGRAIAARNHTTHGLSGFLECLRRCGFNASCGSYLNRWV